MHLLIPFASALTEDCARVLADLQLPHLARLLAISMPQPRHLDDADTLSPPHERALAAAWGWHGADGALPFAAQAAAADGIAVGERAWGLLTPVHLLLGRTHFTLLDPAALQLSADESHALFDAVQGLFESEGFTLAWGAPTRWYAAHASLAELPCASLDRVIGRPVDDWLPRGAAAERARLLRRLQSEVQLLLYPHPVNEAREARGAPTVNSFWLSGCGRAQPADPAAVAVDLTLREPLLAAEWERWAANWRALDAGALAQWLAWLEGRAPRERLEGRAPMTPLKGGMPLAQLEHSTPAARHEASTPLAQLEVGGPLEQFDAVTPLAQLEAGAPLEPHEATPLERFDAGAPLALTLCGERAWQRFDASARSARSIWRRVRGRWRPVEVDGVLEAL